MTTSDSKALAALDAIETAIGSHERGLENFDLGAVCQKYQTIKPLLLTALTLIDKIPLYGSKIATAIRFLMGMADMACPKT